MNLLDIVIILFLISSLFRGREMGLVRQFCSTVGFFGGLLLGSYLQHYTITLAHTDTSKTIVTITTTLGLALVFLLVGEYIGFWAKAKVRHWSIDKIDNSAGAILSAVTLLGVVWLSAAIFSALPFPNIQSTIAHSKIVATLNRNLPPAPGIIADFGKLISPNGFPDVFTGKEPALPTTARPASLASFGPAVSRVQPSVVKIEGRGCGGIVEGSGFVADNNLVITNAHVIAGIRRPTVLDQNGSHNALPILFDPNLDLAILEVENLAGKPLTISNDDVANQSNAAALGYPGGGDFHVSSATILEQFIATGRNIYGQSETKRDVYAMASDIIPGNSGGPVITENGTVIGVVFAKSTTYDNTGYALTSPAVKRELAQAKSEARIVSTGACAQQ